MSMSKEPVGRLGLVAFQQSLKRHNRVRHTLAVADAALSTHLDFQDGLASRFVFDDGRIPVFKSRGFIGSESGVRHEEHVVVELFAGPFPTLRRRVLRFAASCLIEPLIFFGRKPRPVHDLAGRAVRSGEVGKVLQPSVATRCL